MKQVKFIARESIKGITNDEGLKFLDGYYESNAIEVPDEADLHYVFEILSSQFYEEYKHLFNPNFELKYV